MLGFVGEDFPADVLQRTHPVPIRSQAVEGQAQSSCGGSTDVQGFFRELLAVGRATSINRSRQDGYRREADDYCQNQKYVLLHLKFRRPKIRVAAASKTPT